MQAGVDITQQVEAIKVDEERRYVHVQVDYLDRTVINLYETVCKAEDKLQQVLRQDMPNSVRGDEPSTTEAPPDVPLASRLNSIGVQAETTLIHLQSLLDRLEV